LPALSRGTGKAAEASGGKLNARKMVSVTCFGGVSEIGGNKILLEDHNTRLLFDFGTSFARRYRPVSPRTLITVHTEEPAYFLTSLRGEGIEVVLPELGEEISLAS